MLCEKGYSAGVVLIVTSSMDVLTRSHSKDVSCLVFILVFRVVAQWLWVRSEMKENKDVRERNGDYACQIRRHSLMKNN
jgi:hypothetical protein